MDPMAIMAMITPRLLPFDTRTFFTVDSFNVCPLDKKPSIVDLSELKPLDIMLSYELREC